MMASDYRRRDYVVLAVSLAMAGIFIYAAIDKIRDPLQFADSVAAFGILPAVFVSLLALCLPYFEIACGLLMLGPRTRSIGALAITLLSAIFFTALASALLRGLTLDCGCFGAGAPSRQRMWLELVLDMALFAGALFVYMRSIARQSPE
jgi:putative oxidoreductase